MKIIKEIYNDGKEKSNSFELKIKVPTMGVPECMASTGGYKDADDIIYTSFHCSLEEAEETLDRFMVSLSKYFNKCKNDFEVEENRDEC